MFERDRKQITRGGGCLFLLGLPFFVAGAGVAVAGLLDTPFPESLASCVAGLPFAAVGAALMLGRTGVILDRRTRTVTRWWGMLVPFRRVVRPLGEFRRVLLSREVRRSNHSSYDVYPVRIEGPDKPWLLKESRDFYGSRRLSEEVAKFLGVGIMDRTTGRDSFREAGRLDESLRDRLARKGEIPAAPAPLAGSKIQIKTSEGQAIYDIPPSGFKPSHCFGAAVVIVTSIIIFLTVFAPMISEAAGSSSDQVLATALLTVMALAFIGAPMAFTILAMLGSASMREHVVVAPGGIDLERRTCFGPKRFRLSSSEIEEVEIDHPISKSVWRPGRVVSVRADRTVVEFGSGLQDRELDWLRASTCFQLCSR